MERESESNPSLLLSHLSFIGYNEWDDKRKKMTMIPRLEPKTKTGEAQNHIVLVRALRSGAYGACFRAVIKNDATGPVQGQCVVKFQLDVSDHGLSEQALIHNRRLAWMNYNERTLQYEHRQIPGVVPLWLSQEVVVRDSSTPNYKWVGQHLFKGYKSGDKLVALFMPEYKTDLATVLNHPVPGANGFRLDLKRFYALYGTVNKLHQEGCYHLDIRPPNIFVDHDGNWHLGDWGLASSFSSKQPTQLTQLIFRDCHTYIPPEAWPSSPHHHHELFRQQAYQSYDFYMLGIVFFDLLQHHFVETKNWLSYPLWSKDPDWIGKVHKKIQTIQGINAATKQFACAFLQDDPSVRLQQVEAEMKAYPTAEHLWNNIRHSDQAVHGATSGPSSGFGTPFSSHERKPFDAGQLNQALSAVRITQPARLSRKKSFDEWA